MGIHTLLCMCLMMWQVLDSLMVTLSKYTVLLNPASPKACIAFGLNAKARMATETMFELANR